MAAALLTTGARADDWGGSVTLASDKVQRGISQSNGRAALLVDLNRRTDTGWAFGLGLAWPGYGSRNDLGEITLALTRAWQLDAAWAVQLGASHYAYVGDSRGRAYDYDEFSASVGWNGQVFASLAWSPDTSGPSAAGGWRTDQAAAVELTLHRPLIGRLALDAGIGYRDLRAIRGAAYGYGSVGLSWGVGPVQAFVSYIDSRAAQRGLAPDSAARERWVASLLWSF